MFAIYQHHASTLNPHDVFHGIFRFYMGMIRFKGSSPKEMSPLSLTFFAISFISLSDSIMSASKYWNGIAAKFNSRNCKLRSMFTFFATKGNLSVSQTVEHLFQALYFQLALFSPYFPRTLTYFCQQY